jgi:hypothetical protein
MLTVVVPRGCWFFVPDKSYTSGVAGIFGEVTDDIISGEADVFQGDGEGAIIFIYARKLSNRADSVWSDGE